MAPAELARIGVVDRHDPFSQTHAPEYLRLREFLEHAAVLRHVGREMIVESDHDEVVLAPGVAVDHALRAAVIDDNGQLYEMLKPRELRTIDAAVQEHAVERIDGVLAFLKPVAWRVDGVWHKIV